MGNTSGGMMSLLARNTNTSLQIGVASLLKRTRNALLAFSFMAFQVFSPVAIVSAQSNTPVNDDNAGSVQRTTQIASANSVVTNPPLGQSCGLDVALVIDNSGSISSSELATMKSAMTSFTGAFSGTPTQFSVSKFSTTAAVVQGFTGNISTVNTAINSIPTTDNFTNWEDGLLKAQSTFDPRPSVPNMVIFASDGNPNRVDNGTSVSESQAVNEAILVANAIKQAPTSAHMLALGIGNNLDVANLQAISGPSDVISSGFDTLAQDLANLANTLCGGTITTTKLIDQDGNLNTVNDQTPAQNWSFDINGTPSNPAATTTDVNGQTPAVKVDNGTYSVNETQQAGYQLLSASCTGAANNGSTQGNSVTGISVASNNIVSCTFINSPKPTLTLLKTVVNDNGGTKTAADFQAKIDGSNVAWSTAIPLSVGAHTASETGLSTYAASNWGGDCASNGTITLSLGQNATCTITNDDIAPKLTVTKNVVNPYGTSLPASSFPLFVNGNPVTSGVAYGYNVGSQTITETQQTGYQFTGISGDCSLNQDTISVLLSLADNYTCTITNTAIQPKLVVVKQVINDNSGTKNPADFTMTVSGNSQTVPNFAGNKFGTNIGLNEGNYLVDELADLGYTKSFSGDCSGSISIGQTKTCIVTNNDIAQPSIHVVKSGPATAHEGDEVTYSFTVTNTGDVALSTISVADSIAGSGIYQYGDDNGNGSLDKDEEWVYTAKYVIPNDQITNVLNTVTACGYESVASVASKNAVNARVPDTCDTDDHELDVLHPSISVEKSGPETAYEGQEVYYDFAVTNTGDTPLSGLTVQDSIAGNGSYQYGDDNWIGILETGETWYYRAAYTIPANQTANVLNTVEACASEYANDNVSKSIATPKGDICDTDTHELDVLHPSIKVEKSGPASAEAGDSVTYTFKVTNTGDAPLAAVTVDDSITADPIYVSGDVDSDNRLDLTETWIYTVEYLIPTDQTKDVVNTAVVCGYDSEREWEDNVDSFGMLNQETPRVAVCDDDSHTLKITVPVVPAEAVEETLAPAGAPQTLLITLAAILNVTLAVGTLSLARRRLYNN